MPRTVFSGPAISTVETSGRGSGNTAPSAGQPIAVSKGAGAQTLEVHGTVAGIVVDLVK